MLYAIKGNKQLQIDEAEKDTYLKLGYDIAEVDGNELNVIESSPTKTVSYAQFKALQDENEALKADAGSSDAIKAQLAEAEKEIKSLKAKLAESEKKLKEATPQGG